jgi:NAD(P)-dependent dehydrogenase (short-subunit alcohol dehydrogenase family)
VDWLSISDFERDAAVNYFGTVRVSKAFLPLQKQAALKRERKGPRPRIIVVCSASGKVWGLQGKGEDYFLLHPPPPASPSPPGIPGLRAPSLLLRRI